MKEIIKTITLGLILIGAGTGQAAIIENAVSTFDENAANASLPAVSGAYEGDVSATDLIDKSQSTYLSESVTSAQYGAANLNDGVGGGDSTADDTIFNTSQLPATATFHLDTSINALGYDITGVTTVAGWKKNGADLANQHYELLISLVGSDDFISLSTISYVPFTADQGYNTGATKVELTDDTGTIATGVDAVRFVFEYTGESWNSAFDGSVYQEVDVVGTATGGTTATNLSIANSSFELPAIAADGGYDTGEVTSWTESGGTIGVYNPSTSYYSDTSVTDANGGMIGTMDEMQVLFFANDSDQFVTQTLTEEIVAGETYTLTVAVGDRDVGSRSGFAGYDIRLLVDGVAVATNASSVSPGDGTFSDVELVYTATEADSGVLGIQIGTAAAGSGSALDVDHVRLINGVVSSEPFITLTSLKDRQIVQRDIAGQAVLALEGTFYGEGTEIQARAVAIDGNGNDTGWVSIDSDLSGENYAGTLELSEGWYELEIRLLNGTDIVASVVIDHLGVGDVYITCGQSNSANFGAGTPSAVDDRVSYMGLTSGNWIHADDPPENPSDSSGAGGSPWPKLGDLLSADDDVPVGFIPIGDGSSSVEDWTPAQNDNYPNLQDAVQAFATNGFKAILWHQGERDAGTLYTSQADYVSRLEIIINSSRTDAGWEVPWVVALVSYIRGDTNAVTTAAQQQVIDENSKVFVGAATDSLGADYRKDIAHFTSEGLTAHAALWFDALDASFADFELMGLSITGNTASLSFAGPLEGHYRIENTDSLIDPDWQIATDITSLVESPLAVDLFTTHTSSFYRVKQLSE